MLFCEADVHAACTESCAESWLRAVALHAAARAGAVGSCDAVAVVVGGFHRDHQKLDVEKVWKLMSLRMLKLLLYCMLPSCFRFATFVATDLRRAIGERMRKRACVHVLWVACVREFAGDSAATGVRHFAE